MKHIQKQQEPESFAHWKAQANENWQPTYGDLSGKIKKDVKQVLMKEQGWICCYCERRLIDSDSHIEHLKPQSSDDVDPLDFMNMTCSCQNRIEKGEPRHCGNLKEDWYEGSLFITPFDETCEDRFEYTGDGRIKPANDADKAAGKTIEKLGLDIPKLRKLRAQVMDAFFE